LDDLSTIENKAHQGRNGWIVEHRGCLCVCREEKKNQNWPLANEIKIGKKSEEGGKRRDAFLGETDLGFYGLRAPHRRNDNRALSLKHCLVNGYHFLLDLGGKQRTTNPRSR